jgi:hypothetical protein
VPECRRRDDSADDLSLSLERDQRGPDGHAAREVLRPVDRVDDPPDRASVVALLLAQHAFAGADDRDSLPQRALDGSVGIRDRRQVRLGLDLEIQRAESRQAQRVGEVGELEGEGKVAGGDPRTLAGSSAADAPARRSD